MGLFCIFTLFRCFPANRRANHRGRPVLLLPVYAGCGQADACFSRAFFFPSPVFFPFSPQRHFLVPFLFPVSQAERGLWNEGHGRNAAVLFSHERNGEQRGAEARVPYDVEVTFLRRDTQGRPMAAPTGGRPCNGIHEVTFRRQRGLGGAAPIRVSLARRNAALLLRAGAIGHRGARSPRPLRCRGYVPSTRHEKGRPMAAPTEIPFFDGLRKKRGGRWPPLLVEMLIKIFPPVSRALAAARRRRAA